MWIEIDSIIIEILQTWLSVEYLCLFSAPYSTSNSNEMNRYLSPASRDPNSYSSQYPVAKQSNFSCANQSPNYPMNMFYNASKAYPEAKKYAHYGDVNNSDVQENLIRQASSLLSSHQEASQLSSIPTPPETSLPGDDTTAFGNYFNNSSVIAFSWIQIIFFLFILLTLIFTSTIS